MTLFLITGMPAFLVLILNTFFSGTYSGRDVILAAGKGILWFFPIFLIYGLASGYVLPSFEGATLYVSRTLLDLALPYLMAIAAYLISYRRDLIIPAREQFLRSLSFLAGFYMLFAQYVLVTFSGWYAGYLYFLLPLLWMTLTVSAALMLANFFSRVAGGIFLLLPAIVILPFVTGAIPYLYVVNLRFFAWMLTILFAAGSILALRRGFYPK